MTQELKEQMHQEINATTPEHNCTKLTPSRQFFANLIFTRKHNKVHMAPRSGSPNTLRV